MLQQHWRSSKKSYFLLVRRKENTYCCFLPPELIELGLSITWLRSHPPGRQIPKRNNYSFNEIKCFSFSESPPPVQCYRAVLGSVMSAYLSNCCFPFLLFSPVSLLDAGQGLRLRSLTPWAFHTLSGLSGVQLLTNSMVFSLPLFHLSPQGGC